MSQVEIIYLRPQDTEMVYLNREEPTVFEVLDVTTEEHVKLETKITVHNKTKEQDKPVKKKKPYKKNKNIRRILCLFIIMGLFGVVAFNLGYMPIKAFLNVPEPIGCAGEINIDSYMKEYAVIQGIPKLDKIKYKVFVSDASLETVANYYIYELKKDGYSFNYQGTVTKKDITFHYYGFEKGITAIGIILTDDTNDLFGHETAVLSTIGSIYDYQDIVSWYKTNIDS